MRIDKILLLVVLFLFPLLGCGTGGENRDSTNNTTNSLSGTISVNGLGIDGVSVSLNSSSTVTTDADGNYYFSGISDGDYKITPTKIGYIFTPTSKTISVYGGNLTGQDFTGTLKPYTFEKLAGPTIWTNLKRTIAVDSLDQVYLTSGSTIFRVNSSGPTIYLSASVIAATIGGGALPSSLDIQSIDIGPDDRLYILERNYRKILISDGLGSVNIHRDINDIFGFPKFIGVIDYDNILLINLYDGLWFIKGSGNTLLYDDTLVLGGTNCGSEGFAVLYDGSFAYLPGCNGSPMVGGKSDGTGVGILLNNSVNVGLSDWWNFSGIGRDHEGRYITNINGARIARVMTNGQYELVQTDPALDAFSQEMEGNAWAFYYSPVAKGVSGDIYIISETALYVAKSPFN